MERVEQIGDHPEDLFAFAVSEITAGKDCVLVFITAIEGSSSRRVGTPMIVVNDGRYAGYVSSGCLDADIAKQSLETLESGDGRQVRYGKGSPYIDLRLPCGGGLDVVFLPRPDVGLLKQVADKLKRREPANFTIPSTIDLPTFPPQGFDYVPSLRTFVFGESAEAISFAHVSLASNVKPITNPDLRHVKADLWTAIVLLFHDHHKEIDILLQAIKSSAFYIGAMGSRKSHADRIAVLQDLSISTDSINRIRGPIGLVPSTRDAGRLAVSVLGEIFETDRLRTVEKIS